MATNSRQSKAAISFIQSLDVPEGKKAGEPIKLAPYQKRFIRGTLKQSILVGVLCIARGNGKSAITAGLALGELLGVWDSQPRREVVCAARTQQQAKIIFNFMLGMAESLPDDVRDQLKFRRAPYVEIEYQGDGGGHICRCIAANPQNALGTAPTLAIMDERGHWPDEKGDDLEGVLLSGLGKRGGKAVIISTSASSDSHSLSQWVDDPPPGTYVQEHRPVPSLPADDYESLLLANPGAKAGIGSSAPWLQAQAKRAIARGGSSLANFRLYNRNERVSGENRDVLLTVDDWLAAETDKLPDRTGPVVVGVDLGGSASMSAATLYWHETGRLEAIAAFPTKPSLSDRGTRDGVRDRYVQMHERGELLVMGERTVPAAQFLAAIIELLDGQAPVCLVADRYRQSEFEDALTAAKIRAPVIWRGMGFRDGSEDCERFKRAVFDGDVKANPSLLLRSAFADAVTLRDPSNNMKLAKARSLGRIDAAAASVIAVAEGTRRAARPAKPARAAMWA